MVKYDVSRHATVIVLITYICRDEFTVITHRGASINLLYRYTVVVAPIEMPSNITCSYFIYRWKIFIKFSSLFQWQVQNRIFSPVNV